MNHSRKQIGLSFDAEQLFVLFGLTLCLVSRIAFICLDALQLSSLQNGYLFGSECLCFYLLGREAFCAVEAIITNVQNCHIYF